MIDHAEAQAPLQLDREQLLARILSLNPSATAAFLSEFSVEELRRYFDHLRLTDRGTIRLRPARAKAIIARESRI